MARITCLTALVVLIGSVYGDNKPAGKTGGDLWLLFVWNVEGKDRDEATSNATWLRSLLMKNNRQVFAHRHQRVLSGNDATRDGILEGLAWLKKNMKNSDTGCFYISCHGSARKHGWAGAVHPMGDGKKHPFTSKDLVEALTGIKGKVFVSVGSCASGGILEQEGIEKLTNVVILTACQKNEGSSGALNPFAHRGWSGEADTNHDGFVDSREIGEYMVRHHPTKFTPAYYHPDDLPPFPIIKVTKSGKKLQRSKP